MPVTMKLKTCAVALAALTALPVAAATVPLTISPYGGLVVDATGLNGQRLVSQTAASELNKGVARGDPETNDFFIGEQDGFSAALLDQLGGGFLSVSIRLTMFDGDNDPDNFDTNDHLFRVNDVVFGNFSDIVTTTTDADGTPLNGLNDGIGFEGDATDTGTFTLSDSSALAELFASMQQSNSLSFVLDKLDSNGNFFDFTSESRIPYATAGFAPTILSPAQVPVPATGGLMLATLAGLGALRRRARG